VLTLNKTHRGPTSPTTRSPRCEWPPPADTRAPTVSDSTTTSAPWTRRPPEATPGEQSHPHATITTENDPATHQSPVSQPVKDRG